MTAGAAADRVRALAAFYAAAGRQSMTQQLTYRASSLLLMAGMLTEPVIYLVVWSAIARAQGGSVDGYTPGTLAAYYITWTLVRNMNVGYAPAGFEHRITTGRMSGRMLLPIHPIHYDLAGFGGAKIVWIAQWLPVAAVLVLLFHPTAHPTPVGVLVFLVSIWAAFVIRSLFLWLIGLVTFWTTRASALFELYLLLELLLSGRLVPLALLPQWMRSAAGWFPFEWMFSFPINALIAPGPAPRLLAGLGVQALWIGVGALLVAVVWRRAVRRYTGVGA
ncbi:ABC transporter permease [Streptomyces sp. CBMA123]|uniref:ABC transporter permease n=1 Tax=Streptomyces sp. CBMA123 TaxID=1896313 RepID=UPI001661FE98|nr:ABC-2 family transporter protein [Streptomyces sp. CBMA123]MBD0692107.1 ABC transporter permease [Streptomyces sp. CBMA123]